MKRFSALILAATGIANAQTYNYDAVNETLTITGKGNSVGDRITLEEPITPGSAVPGSSEVFGDTKTIILKDVWTSPDSIRVKYVEPTSDGNNTTIKLINSRLGASGDFDMGGVGQTLILDSTSELDLYGNRLTNTTRIENDGYIQTINGTIRESSYLWDNKTSTGSSGVLGGCGYYEFGNVSSVETSRDFGLIKSRGQITDLEISGEYNVNGNSAKTLGDDSYIVGVNASEGSGGHSMTISGKLTVEAKQGTGIGILANQLGSDDASLKNDYSGEISVKAKDALGIKLGTNAAKDPSAAGDIYSLSVGTLNVESTISSGSEQGSATGIYAGSVKRGLSAESIAVKGYTEAAGIQLIKGGSNLSIEDIKSSAGTGGTAAGIITGKSMSESVLDIGDIENLYVGNMEVSSGLDSYGIKAKDILGTNKIGNISVSSDNGNATGISANNVDFTLTGEISAVGGGDVYGVRALEDIDISFSDGSKISASTIGTDGEAFAIYSRDGDARLSFDGASEITGDIKAKNIDFVNAGGLVVNGNIEAEKISAGMAIDSVSGSIKFNEGEDIAIKTSLGSMEAGSLTGDADIAKNTGSVKIGNVKNLTLSNVAGGTSEIGNIENNLTANLEGGSLEVIKVAGTSEIGGSGGTVWIGESNTVNVNSANAGKLLEYGQGISTGGDLRIAVEKAENVSFEKVNGGDANGLGNIKNLTIGLSDGELNIGTSGTVLSNIVVKNASAQVNVGNVKDIDITLSNGADLVAASDSTVWGVAKVNGGCNATFQDIVELRVGQGYGAGGVSGLDGNLSVRGTVNDAFVKDVSGEVYLNAVANSALIENSGSAVIENSIGGVTLRGLDSATVNNSSALITAENISRVLNVGNVSDINASNANINVLDGKTVGGDIVSTSDIALSNGGSATLLGTVSAAGHKLTINGVFDIASSASTVINAQTLSGSGLGATVHNFYDKFFGFSDADDSNGNLTAATTLKGTHNVAQNNITGQIEGDIAAIENAYTTVKIVNVGNNVGYVIEKNSYLSDGVAKSENEKALAAVYDNLEYIEGDDIANAMSVLKKREFVSMAGEGTLGVLFPQSVVHAARMNMDLGDVIHLDTLNRTSATRDMLASFKKSDSENAGIAPSVVGTTSVSVRNINRFASYGGDANVGGSNDTISGGLANIEYIATKSLFVGFGVGGFEAKSNGKGAVGKAETQSFALNAYADYLFWDNFDWYLGATYAFGMNTAKRIVGADTYKGDWDSNLAGVFTGVRYAWKPFEDREIYIKPTLGVNANFLMNPSFEEKGGANNLRVESENYTSVKSLVGIELACGLENGFYLSCKMFYTHEFADDRYDVSSSMYSSSVSIPSFRTKGWEMDRDAGIFGAGVGYDIDRQWRVYLDYAADVSSEVYHNLNAGVQFRF